MFWFKKKNRTAKKIKTVRIPLVKQKGIDVVVDDSGNKINLMFGNYQHIGARNEQEDSFGYSNISSGDEISKKGVLGVLADGMGGLSHGKYISDYVVNGMLKMFESFSYSGSIPSQLEDMVEKINNQISKEFSINGKSSAGSTIVATLLYKTKLYWISVGDSRIYLVRDGFLYQINEDHDYQNKLLGDFINGDIDNNIVFTDPQKDSLTSYIGNEKLPFVDVNRRGFSLQKGDCLILCSDGIYNGITNAEIIENLKYDSQISAEKIAKKVISKKISSQDNLTIMIINYN